VSGRLSQQELELYRITDEVLHYIWDPIEVSEAANARDEYRSYLLRVFKMLIANKPDEDIV
jgi:hypothetical protein